MLLSTVLSTLQQIAPLANAEAWDNVGLLLGDPHQAVKAVLVAIDYTPEVAAESIEKKCDLVIAYHPPLFKPINRLVAGGQTGLLLEAARRGVAIYSPHTAWDAAPGGANDFLADVLMLKQVTPLRVVNGTARDCKLITFVPTEHVDHVADALFAAGAGKIGHYSRCSFQLKGTGTFIGDGQTKPAVGQAGQFERAKEIRIETIVPLAVVDRVVAALKEHHPYETPAFDLQSLLAPPSGIGAGRIGRLPGELTGEMLLNHIKHELGLEHLLVAGPIQKIIQTAACCAGAGSELLADALSRGADFYLTGEIRHHDALRAARMGMVVACTLHSNSERASLKRLHERLGAALSDLPVHLSDRDRDPFSVQ
ncbi:MAG: Nif3-like dinuclear metal center hexameric protein [Phycisphaerae bacterium]|nr:Nif3-like dinuclear metal center hexameric protein [Phycisphaerae bacterium]